MNPRIAMFGVGCALAMLCWGCWAESVKHRERARFDRMMRLVETRAVPLTPPK